MVDGVQLGRSESPELVLTLAQILPKFTPEGVEH